MILIGDAWQQMHDDPEHAMLLLMDFVDDFRRTRDIQALMTPFPQGSERFDALLAATAEHLCKEMKIKPPLWLDHVPSCRKAWFPSGLESLKAIALVESPMSFRIRQIFVLTNFLSRA
ncbi:MAG: hypothetical protein SGJ09_09745 [Phycisphaerae bacterium]|nr:hypothetical protein [Phycisphaerae bacterium]